jgi:hypothetical protein
MGTSSSVVRRRQLKRRKPLTDEQLLEVAMRDALKWKQRGS